mmetsp:Transcript_12457/g.26309  ORF Transcript_12457/g.26309 Transcript_12457/m.26309 type:complete len:235 (-) Transcript_12457:250-954(-)
MSYRQVCVDLRLINGVGSGENGVDVVKGIGQAASFGNQSLVNFDENVNLIVLVSGLKLAALAHANIGSSKTFFDILKGLLRLLGAVEVVVMVVSVMMAFEIFEATSLLAPKAVIHATSPCRRNEFLYIDSPSWISLGLSKLLLLPISFLYDSVHLVAGIVDGNERDRPIFLGVGIGDEKSVTQLADSMNLAVPGAVSGRRGHGRCGLSNMNGEFLTRHAGEFGCEGEFRVAVAF